MEEQLFCKEVFFCSQSSVQHGESVHGTASNYRSFILVEYNEPFPKKIFDTKLDTDWLREMSALAKEKGAKLILIRNSHSTALQMKIIFVDALQQRYCVHIADRENYKYFNLKLYIKEPATGWKTDPFFIVCTNGKKDKCCAKFGFPVFTEIEKNCAYPAFECSHFGGDRFAGNAVLMPYGIYYGRLRKEVAKDLISTTENGDILIDYCRGLSRLKFAKQSAEIYLRKYLNDFKIKSNQEFISEQIEDQELIYKIKNSNGIFEVILKKELAPEPQLLTCTSTKKEFPVKYNLISIKEIN